MTDVSALANSVDLTILSLTDTSDIKGYTDAIQAVESAHVADESVEATAEQTNDLNDIRAQVTIDIATLKGTVGEMRAQQKIYSEKIETVLAATPEPLDLTTRQLMANLAENYQVTYILCWVKVVVGVVLTYILFTPGNFLVALASFILFFGIRFIFYLVKAALASRSKPGVKLSGAAGSCTRP